MLLPLVGFSEPQKAVTYGWGGRLGDNLLDYAHAKWISYKWGIPLLFQTFQYSDQFVFDDVEEKLTPINEANYTKSKVDSLSQLDAEITSNTLYFLAHACDAYEEWIFNGSYGTYVNVDWNDKVFRDMMRTLIAPKYPLNLIEPPADTISVALHYRTGGGFVWDTDEMKRSLPLRFPDNSYYIKQLAKLYFMVNYQPMFVYIFTDHPQPEEIRNLFKRYFPYPNIEFECRVDGNRHDANVLEDLFSMMKFDCLIRPMSHYSITASHLGNFQIEFFPTRGYWSKNKFVVDEVKVIQKGSWDPINKKWRQL
jgi:hypothetical protein